MHSAATRTCPACAQVLAPTQWACPCGGAAAVSAPAPGVPAPRAPTPPVFPRAYAEGRIWGLTPPWFFLLVGLLTAPILTLTPILQYVGWFLASLVHETGHVALAWFTGQPAFPAIRLDGHAVAIHRDQQVVIVVVVWGLLAYGTWALRARPRLRWALLGVTLVYPVLAFTDARELFHLLAGHLGELTFATIFLWRAITGGFTHNPIERGLYGTLGWYLLGRNVFLTVGLMGDAAARARYAGNGSLGLTNDYLRVANDVLHCRLQTVALLMTLVALAVLPTAYFLARAFPTPDRAVRD